jgi:hypothetical protein
LELHLSGFGGDLNGFTRRADCQNEFASIEAVARGQDDSGLSKGIEAIGTGGDFIGAGWQVRNYEGTVFVCLYLTVAWAT